MFKSESSTERIMTEISPMIKDFMSETVSHSKEIQLESEEVVKKIEDNITYFENNRGRMHYDEYKAKGYHIGSGTAESACSRAAIKAVRNDMVIGRSRSDPSVTDTLEKQRMG